MGIKDAVGWSTVGSEEYVIGNWKNGDRYTVV